jgi:hypothetical protein
MSKPDQPSQGAGTDSRAEDWFGQSVDRDAQVAEEAAEDVAGVYGEGDSAGYEFERRARGRAQQEARHGESIDPDQGRAGYGAPPADPT